MNLKKNKLIEEELKVKRTEFFRKLIKHDENWHNGETYKFENDKNEEDIRFSQFKTIILEKDNKNCFIYDEIIKRKDKPILVLKLHNDKKKEILESIIYLEKNEVVQQIKHLSYEQFFNEIKNNEDPIKQETENITIIKTQFLDFIKNANEENIKQNKNLKEEKSFFSEVKKWWKEKSSFSKKWFFFKVAALIGCIIVSTLLGLIPTTIILGITAIKPIAIAVSIGLGFIAIPWNNVRNKIVDWVFGKNKQKNKDWEEIKKLRLENEQLKKELFLSLTPAAKQERILNSFLQVWEKNKTLDFENLEKNLIEKFKENKKKLEIQTFKNIYQQKISQWNENWKEKIEFSKWLTSKHISEIKETFKKNEFNKLNVYDGLFYQPKKIWEEFKKEKIKNITNNQMIEKPKKIIIL